MIVLMANSRAGCRRNIIRRLNRRRNAIAGIVAQINGGAKVFQQALPAAEAAEAVARWAMPFRQARSAITARPTRKRR